MEKKNFKILLWDTLTNDLEKVERFSGTLYELQQRIKELQKGYCQKKEPMVMVKKIKSEGKLFECFVGISDSDFSYISVIRVIFLPL
jgi:uncharacterized membrane protein (DUF106 family)